MVFFTPRHWLIGRMMKFPIKPPIFPIETQIVASCSFIITGNVLFGLCSSSKLIVIQKMHTPNPNDNILPAQINA